MRGLEGMIINMLKGMGFDPDVVKAEIIKRVEQFENGVDTLNSNMENINRRLSAIEAKLGIEETNGTADIRRIASDATEAGNSVTSIGD